MVRTQYRAMQSHSTGLQHCMGCLYKACLLLMKVNIVCVRAADNVNTLPRVCDSAFCPCLSFEKEVVTWNLTPVFFLFLYVNMDVIQHLQCSVIRSGETQKLFLIIRGKKTDPPPSCVWSENVSPIEESQDSLRALKLSSELNILCDLILKNTWTLEQPCLSQRDQGHDPGRTLPFDPHNPAVPRVL